MFVFLQGVNINIHVPNYSIVHELWRIAEIAFKHKLMPKLKIRRNFDERVNLYKLLKI